MQISYVNIIGELSEEEKSLVDVDRIVRQRKILKVG